MRIQRVGWKEERLGAGQTLNFAFASADSGLFKENIILFPLLLTIGLRGAMWGERERD